MFSAVSRNEAIEPNKHTKARAKSFSCTGCFHPTTHTQKRKGVRGGASKHSWVDPCPEQGRAITPGGCVAGNVLEGGEGGGGGLKGGGGGWLEPPSS